MVHCRKFLWGCALFAGLTVVAWGDDEVELRVNGDFGGAAPGAVMAPGWTADELPGQTKVVPGEDWDEFGLKVVAPDGNAKTVCSDFFPVAGRTLKLEVSLRGNGMASVGFQAFDQMFLMTGGGPQYSTYTYLLGLYNEAFGGAYRIGIACAMSYILFIIILIITFIQFKVVPQDLTGESKRGGKKHDKRKVRQ